MADRPILFSAPMVRSLLAGTKTQTRRVLKPQPFADGYYEGQVDCTFVPAPASNLAAYARFGAAAVGGGAVRTETFTPRIAVGGRLWVKHAADLSPVYFKPIAGWEGIYAAGTDGLIYRMDGESPSPLKGSPTSKGYLTVALSNGTWHTKSVHKLVCEAFYGEAPSPAHQVRHIDGDQANNRPQNLDWGTHSDNWQDRKAHGRGMGAGHHSSKLTDEAAAEIRASSLSQRKLAERFGVAQSTIYAIRKGQTWSDHSALGRNTPEFKLWRSPIHMPRWASRLTLTVTDVRVQRLQDISEEDAIAEGIAPEEGYWRDYLMPATQICTSPADSYRTLWDSINGAGSWQANPWCAAYTFTVERRNIDVGAPHV